MDFFEAYPQMSDVGNPALTGRSLRLVSAAGLVYDDAALYFELSEPELWGRLPGGLVSIGVGAAKTQPAAGEAPHRTLSHHILQRWGCEVSLVSLGYADLVLEDGTLDVLQEVDAHTPFMLVFTPPRLGGVQVPDALVQAVYLLPIRRWPRSQRKPHLLRVEHKALSEFLKREDWPVDDLERQPWARFMGQLHFPDRSRVRPVLALRSLEHVVAQSLLPLGLPLAMESGVESA